MPAGRKRHDTPAAVKQMQRLGALRQELRALLEEDYLPALELLAVRLFAEGGISPTTSEQKLGVSHSHWYAITRRHAGKDAKNSVRVKKAQETVAELEAVLAQVKQRRARKKAGKKYS